MKLTLEKSYGKTLRGIMFAVNPIKKLIIKTHCSVHKYIIYNSINILKNENYKKEYIFYKRYEYYLNKGATWADQDFKSSNHFYHYKKGIGIYGFSNALDESYKYYNKAINYIKLGDIKTATFYIGAVCHLVQDVTVPQHVNNKLLNNHRNFELWIIKEVLNDPIKFRTNRGIIYFDNLKDYIKSNAKFANDTNYKYRFIKDKNLRYEKISKDILERAQQSTAGILIHIYKLIN